MAAVSHPAAEDSPEAASAAEAAEVGKDCGGGSYGGRRCSGCRICGGGNWQEDLPVVADVRMTVKACLGEGVAASRRTC